MTRLGWLSAENLATYHTLCLLHKTRRHGEPESLAASFTTVAETRSRPTRQDNDLFVPRSRTEMGRRRFVCRAPILYNALPGDAPELPVPIFARRLKRHLASAEPE